MVFQRSLALTLALIVLSQAILLGGGLLGACAETASRICHCNHASKKEVHAHKEDAIFKKHTKSNRLAADSSETSKMTCHTAGTGVVHTCSCKKQKSSIARLSIYYQTWISDFMISSLVIFSNHEFSLSASMDLILDAWNEKLIKPPRTT